MNEIKLPWFPPVEKEKKMKFEPPLQHSRNREFREKTEEDVKGFREAFRMKKIPPGLEEKLRKIVNSQKRGEPMANGELIMDIGVEEVETGVQITFRKSNGDKFAATGSIGLMKEVLRNAIAGIEEIQNRRANDILRRLENG